MRSNVPSMTGNTSGATKYRLVSAYGAFLDSFFNEQQRKYHHAHSYAPFRLWMPGLMFSTLICVVSLNYISKLQLTWYEFEVFFSLTFAVIISLISTRAYGQTDMDPVSKLGKLSQLLFYGLDDIAQGKNVDLNITGNLFAGGVESVAGEDGSLLQIFKIGYLLMVSAKFQFYGQINGHNDAFYNNTCVLNTESTINCGIFNCNNETNKNVRPILGNNTVILVSNDVSYTVPEQEFQQKYPP